MGSGRREHGPLSPERVVVVRRHEQVYHVLADCIGYRFCAWSDGCGCAFALSLALMRPLVARGALAPGRFGMLACAAPHPLAIGVCHQSVLGIDERDGNAHGLGAYVEQRLETGVSRHVGVQLGVHALV